MADELSPEQQKAEEEALAGLIPVTIDGGATSGGPFRFDLPVLKMGRARRWRKLVSETFAALVTPADSPEGNDAMAGAQLDLIVAYDDRGVLGGREWLEEHATDEESDTLYNLIVEKSYRFVSSPTALVLTIFQQVAALERAKLANGPSPTGTSDQTSSTSASPSPSSTSSGDAPESDSSASSASA